MITVKPRINPATVETVSYLVLNLMWKSFKDPLCFVFVITSRGSIVLMSNDLTIEPQILFVEKMNLSHG